MRDKTKIELLKLVTEMAQDICRGRTDYNRCYQYEVIKLEKQHL